MDDPVKTGGAGEGPARRRTYEPPQVLRLDARGVAAGGDGCFSPGSSDVSGCYVGSAATGSGCATGNAPVGGCYGVGGGPA
jgi:hypothetical protein